MTEAEELETERVRSDCMRRAFTIMLSYQRDLVDRPTQEPEEEAVLPHNAKKSPNKLLR
jgi:hypothetical protein